VLPSPSFTDIKNISALVDLDQGTISATMTLAKSAQPEWTSVDRDTLAKSNWAALMGIKIF
jgi:hypothetical protein